MKLVLRAIDEDTYFKKLALYADAFLFHVTTAMSFANVGGKKTAFRSFFQTMATALTRCRWTRREKRTRKAKKYTNNWNLQTASAVFFDSSNPNEKEPWHVKPWFFYAANVYICSKISAGKTWFSAGEKPHRAFMTAIRLSVQMLSLIFFSLDWADNYNKDSPDNHQNIYHRRRPGWVLPWKARSALPLYYVHFFLRFHGLFFLSIHWQVHKKLRIAFETAVRFNIILCSRIADNSVNKFPST